jgi:hypothetical protein
VRVGGCGSLCPDRLPTRIGGFLTRGKSVARKHIAGARYPTASGLRLPPAVAPLSLRAIDQGPHFARRRSLRADRGWRSSDDRRRGATGPINPDHMRRSRAIAEVLPKS